jgi:hypothetical protein
MHGKQRPQCISNKNIILVFIIICVISPMGTVDLHTAALERQGKTPGRKQHLSIFPLEILKLNDPNDCFLLAHFKQ